MKLFEDKIRTDMEWASHNDNTYEFCDRSAQDKIVHVRYVLNDWFSRYPTAECEELKSRFKVSFNDALYELFLHELFLKQGFEITVHPNVPNATTHPDFLISKNNTEIYVEAKVSTGKTSNEKALDNMTNTVYDAINTICSPNFSFKLNSLQLKTNRQPAIKSLKQFIENQLQQYDPDIVERQICSIDYYLPLLPSIIYDDDNIHIALSLIPRPKEKRNNSEIRETIAIYPCEQVYSEENNIKTALKKKATKYGNLDKPYIVCINSIQGVKVSDFDAMGAVLGSLQYLYPATNAHDGFFGNRNKYQHTRVSAVLITNMVLGSHCNPNYWFFKHPAAHREVDFDLFDLGYYQVESNRICKHEGLSVGDILSVSTEEYL
ncbi:MAG: hypothetical protein LBM61_00275 [Prevotellaceae bacterium]|nr:hypothetical protein [Prevotellaceae bacterium]